MSGPTNAIQDVDESRLARNRIAAREYRARNRETVNEKARQRMQSTRAKVKTAPQADQLDQQAKNRLYSATYRDRHASSIRVRAKVRKLKQQRRDRKRQEASARLTRTE